MTNLEKISMEVNGVEFKKFKSKKRSAEDGLTPSVEYTAAWLI